MNLSKTYNPKKVEKKIYQLWEKSCFFNPDKLPGKRKRAFIVTMAPPNITGNIHVGHALENTLSDALIRQKRMQGYKTLFLPGKDHAGIAAQYVVEKELKKEGKNRFELGKEKFLQRMWQWMERYGQNIDQELKQLGLSCDWSRKRWTLDKNYQEAVKRAFWHYQKRGWIYRGKRIVNWCPRCKTSISDLEVEYKEEKGKLWYIKYPLKSEIRNPKSETNSKFKIQNSKFIVVATTRPETMLGDAAIAVNPKDKRYKNLIGKTVILPIQEREIPVIADNLVNQKFGTGVVKVTPAHDSADFEIAQKHKLPFYYIVTESGKITKEAPVCEGLSTKECREKVLKILKTEGLLEKEEDYQHNLGLCGRCKTIVEPLISEQWFLSMPKLANLAVRAARENKIKFIPSQRKRIFIKWLKNIKDWNISRQLWWGHKIPIRGENDVLDTWFSSALWPFAALGWPKKTKDLKEFYPTTLISSAREIFFLWISRMVFSGLEFTGKVPFKIIYTHPTVLDKRGRKMSKSLGNVVDPMELIKKYGIDATRFGLVWQTTGTQDIHWSEDSLLTGKKFCNKIWNASRFVLANKPTLINADKLGGFTLIKNLTKADKEILKTLEKTIKAVNKDLENFRFGQALQTLYHFFWHQFCDIYIEKSKSQKEREITQKILLYVLLNSIKLLHPFLPFITEEIYQKLPLKNKKKCLMVETWPY